VEGGEAEVIPVAEGIRVEVEVIRVEAEGIPAVGAAETRIPKDPRIDLSPRTMWHS
jgi:hypothetical protein